MNLTKIAITALTSVAVFVWLPAFSEDRELCGKRGSLEITIQDLTKELSDHLHFPTIDGVLIASVEPNGPGDRAGLQRLDIVTSYNGAPVVRPEVLLDRVRSSAPSSKATLVIFRKGETLDVHAQIGVAKCENGPAMQQGGP